MKKLLLSFDKLMIFPLCIAYIIVNIMTILNYEPLFYPTLYYKLWSFCNSHDILDYFHWLCDIGMELSVYYNDKISIVLILMIIADIVFSIKNGRKQIIKWILYGIMTVIILFIGFVASPRFFDSV